MFSNNKKSKIPPVTYIWLSFNLSAMERWVKNKKIISPISKWDSADKTKKILITLLPQDPFLFFHNEKNQLSPGIGGYEHLESEAIELIEWRWDQTHFFVLITNETVPVFFAPLSEIFHLLKNKTPSSLTAGETNIKIKNEYCENVHQYPVFGSGLGFRNELIDISFVCANADNLVQY